MNFNHTNLFLGRYERSNSKEKEGPTLGVAEAEALLVRAKEAEKQEREKQERKKQAKQQECERLQREADEEQAKQQERKKLQREIAAREKA